MELHSNNDKTKWLAISGVPAVKRLAERRTTDKRPATFDLTSSYLRNHSLVHDVGHENVLLAQINLPVDSTSPLVPSRVRSNCLFELT
jgi:hypothetical protein